MRQTNGAGVPTNVLVNNQSDADGAFALFALMTKKSQ